MTLVAQMFKMTHYESYLKKTHKQYDTNANMEKERGGVLWKLTVSTI